MRLFFYAEHVLHPERLYFTFFVFHKKSYKFLIFNLSLMISNHYLSANNSSLNQPHSVHKKSKKQVTISQLYAFRIRHLHDIQFTVSFCSKIIEP